MNNLLNLLGEKCMVMWGIFLFCNGVDHGNSRGQNKKLVYQEDY